MAASGKPTAIDRHPPPEMAANDVFEALFKLDRCLTALNLQDELLDFVRKYGFRGYTLAVERQINSTRIRIHSLVAWPKLLSSSFLDSELVHRDPVVMRSHTEKKPFVWDLSIYDPADPCHARILDIRHECKVTGGICVPVRGAMGDTAILFISGRDFPAGPQTLMALRVLTAHVTACLHGLRMADAVQAKPSSHYYKGNRLTAREREVMSWIALGKSSRDVAVIMGISEHTVNDHIARAMGKLSAANRTDAVIRALMLDDINLG
jgi:LuxR family transcriptional regulator, quorum-sensing system regulator BjaR1